MSYCNIFVCSCDSDMIDMIKLLETNGAVFNCRLQISEQASRVPANEVEYPIQLDVSIEAGVIVATHAQ